MSRSVAYLALLVAAAVGALETAPPALRVGDAFPRLEGQYLTGKAATLPEAAAGRTALVLLGFTYASREPVEAWGRWFREKIGVGPSATFYEVPMIGGAAKLARWFIDRGMRKGTPPEFHEHVITVYSRTGDWKARLGVASSNEKDAFLVVLDGAGVVRWLYRGPFDEGRAAEVARLFKGE